MKKEPLNNETESKELKQVTFTFEDESTLVLEGEELVFWQVSCFLCSDYLVPHNEHAELGTRFGGIVRGFVA